MVEYIERKIATDVVGDIDTTYPSDDKEDIIEKAIGRLDRIPAADVAPVVHGRWEKHMEYDFLAVRYFQAGFKCSCCGIWRLDTRGLNYCYNCGARMDGE